MSEKNTGTVSFTPNLDNPPTLTPEQRQRLSAMRDEDIDLSDIPSQADRTDWTRPGRVGPIAAMRRAALAEGLLQVEPDVLEFFRETGDRVPERINAVLREYVEAHRKSA